MAKIRIPVEKMPPPDIYGNQVLQFRIVSEDRNRVSAWSPLYKIKSLGQYRPYRSQVIEDLVTGSGQTAFTLTWDTPTYYNYDPSLTSASIMHNHSQNFKQHPTDIYIRWYNGSSPGHFEYHDRVLTDNTSIIKSTSHVFNNGVDSGSGPTNVQIVGLISTYGLSGVTGDELDNAIDSMKDYLAIFDVNLNLSSGVLTYNLPLFS